MGGKELIAAADPGLHLEPMAHVPEHPILLNRALLFGDPDSPQCAMSIRELFPFIVNLLSLTGCPTQACLGGTC